MKNKIFIMAFVLMFVSGCFNNNKITKQATNDNQLGRLVFEQNCVVCHGQKAQGTKNWRQKINGEYPAPPLNGTAHAWHHSPSRVLQVINEGSSNMPSFKDKLSEDQKQAVFWYLYSLWPLEAQEKYDKRFF